MIACCLLTCDRLEYTARTLESFAAHNDPRAFALFHGDDASSDPTVPDLVRRYGFHTITKSAERQGWLIMRRRLFTAAAERGADWILYLENDVEWARPFPWTLFELVRESGQCYCLRLQGPFKDRERRDPCLIFHKGDRRKPVKWKPIKRAPEPAQIGRIHWSAQPSVTRTSDLLAHHFRNGVESSSLTARVLENVTYHIGVRRTEAA